MAGNTAADVRAGGAWYEMYGKDRLTPVIEKAKKSAESLGGAMKKVGSVASTGVGGIVDGIRGKLGAGIADFGSQLSQGLIESVSGVARLRKEFEAAAKAIDQTQRLEERNRARLGALIEAEIDPAKKLLAINEAMKKLEHERGDATRAVAGAKAKKKELGDSLGATLIGETDGSRPFEALGLWISGGLDDARSALNANVAAQEEALQKLHDRLLDLGDQRGKLLNPDRDEERIRAVNEMVASLKKEADTWGQAADRVALYDLKVKGFSDKQIAAVEASQKRLKLQETLGGAAAEIFGSSGAKAAELTEELKRVTDELKKQADTWNMAAGQIALYDLKAKGFADSAIGEAKSQVERMGMLSTLGGAIDAIAQGAATAKSQGPASLGSFSAVAASQRFGQTDSKKLGDIVDNTAATAKAAEAFVKGFVLK